MAIIRVLGGDFDKADASYGFSEKTGEFIFKQENSECVINRSAVACTYYATSEVMRRADVPEQLVADFAEARETWHDPAGMEIVVVFDDCRWAYVRATKKREALAIHKIKPTAMPGPPVDDPDREERVSPSKREPCGPPYWSGKPGS